MGELEDEMKKMEDEDAREQGELRARIKQLDNNVREYENMLNTWQERYREVELVCGRERQLRQNAEQEAVMLRRGMGNGTDAVPLPPRRSNRNDHIGEHAIEETNGGAEEDEVPLTCGMCNIDTRCQCIEDAFNMGGMANDEQEPSTFKRPLSPQSNTANKRPRQSSNYDPETEIDFTAQFSSQRPPTLTTSASTSSSIAATAPPDPCGFCSDGTSCICAEISNEGKHPNNFKPPPSPYLASTQPSVNRTATSDPCINGPGTCAQCMSDPASKTFCQSVAASRPSALKRTSQAISKSLQMNRATNSTLNCAVVFTMLSQHPSFDTARSDMSTWVPQLTAIPRSATAPERTAFDIEAASVMSVLRFFDRRFGSSTRPTTPVSEGEAADQSDGKKDDKHAGRFIAYDGPRGAGSVRGPDMRSYKRGEGDE